MSKTLIIAEKPAMGRDISQALSASTGLTIHKKGLYEEVGDYLIVGAQGHLFSLCDPEFYGSEFNFPWRVDPLPVLPTEFRWELNLQKEKGKVKKSSLNDSVKRRAEEIAVLLRKVNTVIHAGDPDREGQLIIDNILRVNHFKGNVQRLWLHAQTQDGILDAWSKMKNNQEYKKLGTAALARAESDWAIGLNATRAYSSLWWKAGNKGVLNVGRVTTPVVSMVVEREQQISSFAPVEHYGLTAQIDIPSHPSFKAAWVKPAGEPPHYDLTGKFLLDLSYAESLAKQSHGKAAIIKEVVKKPGLEQPPLLFSLVELQKTAAKMGYSPDTVLAAAQTLYSDLKLISYPRTECQFAPESEHHKSVQTLQMIAANLGSSWKMPEGVNAKKKSRAWDDAKLAEHYAIIPLPTKLNIDALSSDLKNRKTVIDVYRLVCRQYVAQFMEDFQFESTVININIANLPFRATGKVSKVEGWKALYGGAQTAVKANSDDEQAQDLLPSVKAGDAGVATSVQIVKKKTEPPKRFTAITLLEAMEKAYLFVTDPEIKKRLKQIEGLGTAATRAEVIAKIVRSEFVTEHKSGKVISYAPTEKAFSYARCLPEKLCRPDLTAWFEGKLEEIAKGEIDYSRYREILNKLVVAVIEPAKDGSFLSRCKTSK